MRRELGVRRERLLVALQVGIRLEVARHVRDATGLVFEGTALGFERGFRAVINQWALGIVLQMDISGDKNAFGIFASGLLNDLQTLNAARGDVFLLLVLPPSQ